MKIKLNQTGLAPALILLVSAMVIGLVAVSALAINKQISKQKAASEKANAEY